MNEPKVAHSGRNKRDATIVLVLIAGLMIASYHIGGTLGRRATANAMTQELQQFVRAQRHTEAQALERTYGPSRHSKNEEEWILKDFFRGERGGVFIDVGANHYQRFSNTYYLEHELGWSGIAIEPQTKFAADYEQYRPRTRFVPVFVSDVSDRQATLYVTGDDLVASGVREFTEAFGTTIAMATKTSTLDDVLERFGIGRIDFLSMDIELAEPQALKGFSIARFAPRLVVVEAHAPVRQQILDYFAANQYVLLGRYWRADTQNFWFAPLGSVNDDPALVSSHSH